MASLVLGKLNYTLPTMTNTRLGGEGRDTRTDLLLASGRHLGGHGRNDLRACLEGRRRRCGHDQGRTEDRSEIDICVPAAEDAANVVNAIVNKSGTPRITMSNDTWDIRAISLLVMKYTVE